MKAMNLSYGPCLSEEEYISKLAELRILSSSLAASGESPESIDKRTATIELNLTIDIKLGVNFPEEKRKPMRRVHRAIQSRRGELASRLGAGDLTNEDFANEMQGLTQWMAVEFGKILNDDELCALLDIEPGTAPVLPIDPKKIRT